LSDSITTKKENTMQLRLHTLLFLLLVSGCYGEGLQAQNAGDLDGTFGDGGTSITYLDGAYDLCAGLVIQPDQKIVIGGRAYVGGGFYPTLVRMNPDGSPDNTFGGDGIASGDVAHSTTFFAEADALALQPDGKFLYAFHLGFFGSDGLAVTRFNSDGSVDTDFGDNGTVSQIVLEYSNYANSLLLQDDGKILVTGLGQLINNGAFSMIAVRFTADGELDETFADNGIFIFQQGQGNGSQIIDVKQQADGKILLAGHTSYSAYNDITMVRLNEDGMFDDSFGDSGIFNFNVSGSYDFAKFIQPRLDGSILVAGSTYTDGNSNAEMLLASVTPDGELDGSFGNNGVVIPVLGENDDMAESVIVAPDGKIILVGRHEISDIHGAVLRFNADGTPDDSFGDGGVAFIEAYSYFIENVRLQSDGKIVVCGWMGFEGTNEHTFTASRLLSEGADAIDQPAISALQVSIFPNPADNVLHVKWNRSIAGEPVDVLITDASGKVVSTLHTSSLDHIDTTALPEGVYSISVRGERTNTIDRFVIAR
jgi:uncharacterized delta-60 repeat protein